ncbi:DUF6286 domain-containing protein, partial [Corynebacterium sp.]|uniref:DUF6286 domain-containing protein n=1 Tax=Corynebacterium sp. TaxID=1720 RepID=UPI0019CD496E
GVVAALLGAFLVWSAFRPRTRTHRRIRSTAPVWMRPVDISRTLCAAARTVPGVASAASHVSGDTAHVSVTGHREDLAELVDAALHPLLNSLDVGLTLQVRQRPLAEMEEP